MDRMIYDAERKILDDKFKDDLQSLNDEIWPGRKSLDDIFQNKYDVLSSLYWHAVLMLDEAYLWTSRKD